MSQLGGGSPWQFPHTHTPGVRRACRGRSHLGSAEHPFSQTSAAAAAAAAAAPPDQAVGSPTHLRKPHTFGNPTSEVASFSM
mmetsp:Transcript_28475/g.55986  ORF Transcript_28475/g.55986 Transcript_28475/m.55986 type:complete len:82 (+) Transcript_28475:323-568(+)